MFSAGVVGASVAFAALIWWVVPGIALIGAICYLTWVSRFKNKFESETHRSVGNFQKFQDSFRESPAKKSPRQPHS
jgi:hypothetical protein